jgi:hypothetical protein
MKAKDTRKGDRHSPGYLRAYMREWMRRKRAKQKAIGKIDDQTYSEDKGKG